MVEENLAKARVRLSCNDSYNYKDIGVHTIDMPYKVWELIHIGKNALQIFSTANYGSVYEHDDYDVKWIS